MRRVGIRANEYFARHRVAFRHHRVRDTFRTLLAIEIAVIDEVVLAREQAVALRLPAYAGQQVAPDVRRRAMRVGIVILEAQDRVGLMKLERGALVPVQEVAPHRRVHLVDEAIARPHEAAGSRTALPVDTADGQPMAPDDLLDQGARLAIVGQRFRCQVLQMPHTEPQQPAFRKNARRKRLAIRDQFLDTDALPGLDALDQPKIR